jgi:hypothetical protein
MALASCHTGLSTAGSGVGTAGCTSRHRDSQEQRLEEATWGRPGFESLWRLLCGLERVSPSLSLRPLFCKMAVASWGDPCSKGQTSGT